MLRGVGYFKSNIVLRNEASALKLMPMRRTCEQALIGNSTTAVPSGLHRFEPHARTGGEGTGEERGKAWKFAGTGRRHRHQDEGH